jgi:membrane-bound lytic murein transglycosylase D
MTRKRNATIFLFLTALAFISIPLFAQQSQLQTSFLAPAAVRNNAALASGISAIIVRAEHLPYLTELSRIHKSDAAAFQPTPSDLLIQKAEERFRAGRKFFRDRDFDHARTEFDGAVDLMLNASESPTDRRLYEARLEEMVDSIHRDDLSGMGAEAPEEVPGFDKAPLDDIVTTTFPVDPRIKDKVQSQVKLTTSALPLVVNDTVLGYINYFAGRGHRTIEVGLQRAGRYQAMVSKILAEEGVPQELIHLAQAESGFLPRAVSRAAATGMWQFVKFRGNQYGLEQTANSDDRLDPEKATRAAARHLHDLYNEFGDWYLAIAAYNCGPGNIEKAVERTGYADFWELRERGALPKETTNYVPIILAMTIMSKNAAEYGLDQIVPDAALEYDTIVTPSPTNIALLADLTDTSVGELMQLNPALLRSMAPGSFEIRVPKGAGQQVSAALDLIPAERRASWRMHRVEEGETLASVARLFNLTSEKLAAANDLKNEAAPGDRLLIPIAYHETAAPLGTAKAVKGSTSRTTTVASSTGATRKAGTSHIATASRTAPARHPAGSSLAQLKVANRSLSR